MGQVRGILDRPDKTSEGPLEPNTLGYTVWTLPGRTLVSLLKHSLPSYQLAPSTLKEKVSRWISFYKLTFTTGQEKQR